MWSILNNLVTSSIKLNIFDFFVVCLFFSFHLSLFDLTNFPPKKLLISSSFQYVYLKQMTKAAVVIQNQFRSYYEHKRFKKNMESPSTSSGSAANSANNGAGISSSAAAVAAAYRNYRESSLSANSARQSREGTPTSSALKYVFYVCFFCTKTEDETIVNYDIISSRWLDGCCK